MLTIRSKTVRWIKWLGALAALVILTGCPKPPDKAMTDAEQALLDARGVKDCASDKYKAAQALLEEADALIEREEFDAAERKARAAKKLAAQAKAEGEANWEDCQKKDTVADADAESDDDEASGSEDGADDAEDLDLQTVYFGYDSAELSSEARAALEENVRWMEAHPDADMVLEGHTDERGTPEYNLSLGESRAMRVKKYLVQFGIDADRVGLLSYGEEKPDAYGTTSSDHAKNRRVEFAPKR
ncbi:MAG: OmpA family protein [Persicimonas sp.]